MLFWSDSPVPCLPHTATVLVMSLSKRSVTSHLNICPLPPGCCLHQRFFYIEAQATMFLRSKFWDHSFDPFVGMGSQVLLIWNANKLTLHSFGGQPFMDKGRRARHSWATNYFAHRAAGGSVFTSPVRARPSLVYFSNCPATSSNKSSSSRPRQHGPGPSHLPPRLNMASAASQVT